MGFNKSLFTASDLSKILKNGLYYVFLLFSRLLRGICHKNSENTTILLWQDLIAHQIKFLEGAAKNDVVLVGRYKQWLGMLTKGYREAQTLWEGIKREKNKAAIISALYTSVGE